MLTSSHVLVVPRVNVRCLSDAYTLPIKQMHCDTLVLCSKGVSGLHSNCSLSPLPHNARYVLDQPSTQLTAHNNIHFMHIITGALPCLVCTIAVNAMVTSAVEGGKASGRSGKHLGADCSPCSIAVSVLSTPHGLVPCNVCNKHKLDDKTSDQAACSYCSKFVCRGGANSAAANTILQGLQWHVSWRTVRGT
jgi:hypothetical protein